MTGIEAEVENFVVQTTAYGRPAVDLVAGQLQTLKGGDPLAPVTVIVPPNYAAVSTRRVLAGRPGGVANVTFLTVFRLAERLGARSLAAAGRRPVSTPVRAQAIRAILAADPGVFAPVADHPATELALGASTRELAGLSDAALAAVAANSARAADVVRVARQARHDLAADWYDEHDLLRAATTAVDQTTRLGPVIVHLLQDLSPAGADLLCALARHQTVLVNVGLTGDAEADQPVLAAHARAGLAVGAAKSGFRRSDVLAIVTGAPTRHGDGPAPGRAWERISRAAGVVAGEDWAPRLAVFAADQRGRAVEADEDEQDQLAEHLRRDADRAEELAQFVADLKSDLSSLPAAGSWAALVDVSRQLVARYLGG